MPMTKDYAESLRVDGMCADWYWRCLAALEQARFSRILGDDQAFIIDADYRGFTIDGSIRLLLSQEREQVAIEIRIIAAVDNVWALKDPMQRILSAFKKHLR